MQLKNDVFERKNVNGKLLDDGTYNLVMGGTLLWGFILNYFMVTSIDPAMILSVNPILFFVGYFACAIAGVFMFNGSDNPAVSFLGYNLVVLPFGLVVNIVVHQYDPQIVQQAILVTGMVTAGMMILGSLFPAFFRKIAGALTIALFLVIIAELILMFIFKSNPGIIDWIVVLIFCGYIGYDWVRANAIPKTLDNAIDSAAALYMDIIILFLRILRIMGRRR
ncbi:MAG: Bax inhibitor-1 family protein [Spirochaetota bacterium]